MRLLRHGFRGHERPGRLDADGRVRDLSGIIVDVAGAVLCPDMLGDLARISDASLPIVEPLRIGACVGAVGKIVCVGLNYADHAAEAGRDLPTEPALFLKATSAISGPYDDIEQPVGATKLDYEVELGVVIGRRAKAVAVDAALQHVAGYCVVNDVSERAFQSERGGQWTKGKSADTFAPLGPWLVTRDEVADPQALKLWLDVDGEARQRGSTADMVFGVAELVAYISRFMTLEPGDVVATGTPAGVALGMRPPRFLQPGQRVTLGIAGLGKQCQRVVEASFS